MLTMAKAVFLLLLLCAIGVLSSDIEKRLVSASTCPDTERRYHVRVVYEYRDGTSMTCGGTLIDKKWVITASHCYAGRNGKLKVEIGGHPASSVKQQMKISKFFVYPTSQSEEPIMLLKLPSPVKNTVPAVLPSADCIAPHDGDELQVSGRGATKPEGGPGVKDLMCLDIKALSKSQCPDLAGTGFEQHTYIFCGEKTSDAEIKACKGDSGSGLLKKEMVSKSSFIFWTKEEKVDMLYGVLLSGHKECEDKFVFVDICARRIRKWIDKIMG